MIPNFEIEQSIGGLIIGVDEAGRGPLAGPVVAAAAIIDDSAVSLGINDSKKISKLKREKLYNEITTRYKTAVGIVHPKQIDEINILQATMLAMRIAIEKLTANYPDASVLVDGNKKPIDSQQVHAIVKGDSKSLSIAAASIVAKVTRDKIMQELSSQFPEYGWEKNSGYGTKEHMLALAEHGITEHHRQTFLRKFKAAA